MEPTIKDFESAIAELDAIVKRMEEGDLTLEKSMELYERGLQLSKFCHSTLEAAERRIEILSERGEVKPAPASLGLGADDEGERRLQAVLDAGGRLVSDAEAPSFWVVEDADGNRSCICTHLGR